MIRYFLTALTLAIPSLALADAAGRVFTLTPEQVEAAKEAGAARHAKQAALESNAPRDRAIHGEVGFGIGTGGYREAFGTAVVPLGDNGLVALSYDNAEFGFGRGHRYRR